MFGILASGRMKGLLDVRVEKAKSMRQEIVVSKFGCHRCMIVDKPRSRYQSHGRHCRPDSRTKRKPVDVIRVKFHRDESQSVRSRSTC